MLNHIVIMGRLTRDPELRYTQSQIPVASFRIAVDRDFGRGEERQTDFIDIVAWRSTGEFVNKYFRKGSMIAVSGPPADAHWTDRDGNKRTSAVVVADNVYFGDSARRDGEGPFRRRLRPRLRELRRLATAAPAATAAATTARATAAAARAPAATARASSRAPRPERLFRARRRRRRTAVLIRQPPQSPTAFAAAAKECTRRAFAQRRRLMAYWVKTLLCTGGITLAFDNKNKGRKRKKVCQFCVDKVAYIDYKDTAKLRKFVSERSKILPAAPPAPAPCTSAS